MTLNPTAQLTQAIYEHLTSLQDAGTVYQLLGGRIYTLTPPMRTTLPWLGLAVKLNPIQSYFDLTEDLSAELETSLWSPLEAGLSAAQAIQGQLHAQLHRQSIAISDMPDGQLLCTQPGQASPQEGGILIQSRWRLWVSLT